MTVSRFLLTAILARRMGVESFGVYAYSQWLIDIGFLVCTFGVTGVASRYLAEFRHEPRLMAAIVRRWRPLSIALPGLAAVIASSSAWLTGVELEANGFALLLVWGFSSGLWGMHTAALVGLQRFDLIFTANLVAAAIMLTGAAFISLNDTPYPVFGLMALASISGAMVGVRPIFLVGKGPTQKISTERKRTIYIYALNIWLTALMWSLVWSRGEVPIIRNILGNVAVAEYSVALTLYGGAVAGVMLGVSGVSPQITRFLGERNLISALGLCRKAMDIQLLLSGLGALFLIWTGPELMLLAFGEDYENSAPLLGILALGLPALTVASHNHLLQIETNSRYNRNVTFFGVVLLLTLAFLGVTTFGLTGGAVSRAVTLSVMASLTIYVCVKKWGLIAISVENLLLVAITGIVSVVGTELPLFDSLYYRLLGFLVCSAILLLSLRAEDRRLLIMHVFLFIRFRSDVRR